MGLSVVIKTDLVLTFRECNREKTEKQNKTKNSCIRIQWDR